MNTARLRSLVLYVILGGFLAGLIFFIGCYFVQGGTWAMRPANQHLQGSSQLSNAGTITDRNGNIIAQSVDGERVYSEDYTTRCALLHVLGDTDGYISTGIQNIYLSGLTGFNPVLGIAGTSNGSSGQDIQMTVDSNLSALALQQLGDRKGAVAMYNYKTGDVLCFVSTPTYDPENVPDDLTTNAYYDGVFLNKALSGTFTPGSTFKIVTTACALENIKDIDKHVFHCEGTKVINGNTIVCDSHTAHGDQTLQEALTNSCNVAFAELADELGSEKMMKTAEEMGFNKSFSVDDNKTVASNYRVNSATSAEDLAWSGIGQYTDTANPAHMMTLMGAIANGGTPVLPHTVKDTSIFGGSTSGGQLLSKEVADRLKTMMRNNVKNGYGDSLFPGMEVCAKTGTAEVEGEADTGWIVGFSQNAQTPYAFAIVVEEGGYGLSSAGAIASALMNAAVAQ
ncbi:MAG: penicillin-binding transpeptidase domain-containing protein [Oscillospiraceae bacterium]|nr:penicillin-binding transpeptidase domain-containing protein [Oscillospiraceae bacterium]